MRTVIITLGLGFVLACLAVVSVGTAQQNHRPTPEEWALSMDQVMKLSADQKARIIKFYRESASKPGGYAKDGYCAGGTLPLALGKILSKDQMKNWKAYSLQEHTTRRINQIDQDVTLTADQKIKIKPVLEKEHTAYQDLWDAMMAKYGRKFDINAFDSKYAEYQKATIIALRSILTEEQMNKYRTRYTTINQRNE